MVETILTCGVQIVLQKFLVVTCNYIARALGVPKMVSIEEARRRLVLVLVVECSQVWRLKLLTYNDQENS